MFTWPKHPVQLMKAYVADMSCFNCLLPICYICSSQFTSLKHWWLNWLTANYLMCVAISSHHPYNYDNGTTGLKPFQVHSFLNPLIPRKRLLIARGIQGNLLLSALAEDKINRPLQSQQDIKHLPVCPPNKLLQVACQ